MILLYKGKSAISKAIRWRTWGDYSHAAWWMRDGTVIESWHKGGVTHNEGPGTIHTPGTVIDVFDFENPAEIDTYAAERFLVDQVGKGYDFRAVLSGFTFRIKRDNSKKWFCSELVFVACAKGGYALLRRIPAWKVSPSDLNTSPRLIKVGTLTITKDHTFTFKTADSMPQAPCSMRTDSGGADA